MGKVLIIEDEQTIKMILEEILTDEGYQVTTATDGSDGLNKLQTEPKPDIVLVDLRMPNVTGKDVVLKMRSIPKLKDIPVIIISGAVYDPSEFPPEGSYQANFGKPFDLIEVVREVQKLIG